MTGVKSRSPARKQGKPQSGGSIPSAAQTKIPWAETRGEKHNAQALEAASAEDSTARLSPADTGAGAGFAASTHAQVARRNLAEHARRRRHAGGAGGELDHLARVLARSDGRMTARDIWCYVT